MVTMRKSKTRKAKNPSQKKKAPFPSMREVMFADYEEYVKNHSSIIIEDVEIPIGEKITIKEYEPKDFELETTTVWSFPKRGSWATHKLNAKYRGNWAPQVPRNLILRYTEEGETVLDPFVGSGTTLIETKLLGRNGIGVDINYEAIILTLDRLRFRKESLHTYKNGAKESEPWIKTFQGDARNLDKIPSESVDLIATHPPYANIIRYTKNSKDLPPEDLSRVRSIAEFQDQMFLVAKEFYRVLKPGKYCAVLIGDTRRHKHYVPIAFRVMQAFLDAGFILKEDIIKIQHNMKTTPFWKSRSIRFNFLLLAHEHLFVFRKPSEGESLKPYKESMRWW